MSSCSKTRSFIGTYDGITIANGSVAIVIPGYIENYEELPEEKQNIRFVISKGQDKNKIVLKQVYGETEDQFEAIGIVNDNKVSFLPFTVPISYGDISVDAQVLDMKGTLKDGKLTYDYTYSYAQFFSGASISINMKANGTAEKQK
jgi:hypothetical protein